MDEVKVLTQYLTTIFGTNMLLEEFVSYRSLPMYLSENYQMIRLQLYTDEYLLVLPKEQIKFNISALKKQLGQIQRYTNLRSVLVIDRLRLVQRNALIQAGIAFIVPGKQLFIPQCVMDLSETESQVETYGDHFSVAAQVVFSYLLLHRITETNAHSLSVELRYSVPTINRAFKELCYRKLLYTVGNGTRKQYRIKDVRVYWEKGKEFLFDPVKGRRYVKMNFGHSKFQMSNDLALSRLSDLSGGNICFYAASAQTVKQIDPQYILNEYDVFDHDYCVVEVFRYDPKLLSNSRYIDVISLYAQFKDHRDERVQIEIESLVKEILW